MGLSLFILAPMASCAATGPPANGAVVLSFDSPFSALSRLVTSQDVGVLYGGADIKKADIAQQGGFRQYSDTSAISIVAEPSLPFIYKHIKAIFNPP